MYERLTLMCDRCHRDVEAMRTPTGTVGYYDVSNDSQWHRFARSCELVVCDSCMWADPAYRAVYGIHNL